MRRSDRPRTAAVALLAALVPACATAREEAPVGAQPAPALVSALVAEWPAKPREVANAMIAKYGQPHEATPTHLVWHEVGPWEKTIVNREEVPHDFPKPHTDILEQVIHYRVPPDLYDEIARFDGSVILERTKGTMAARCDMEEANFLALNLAHDIVTGRRTVEQARQFYAETIQALMRGERRPYVQGFRFRVPEGGTGDPDVSLIRQR